jgi:hypothetical protein
MPSELIRNRGLRMLSLIALGVVCIYIVVAVTPLKYRVVRVGPDIGRLFFPPFFFYTREYSSGSVGPLVIGDGIDGLQQALESRYGAVEVDRNCGDYRVPTETIRSRYATCYTTRSLVSRYPLIWLVGHDGSTVTRIRVTTKTPMDF